MSIDSTDFLLYALGRTVDSLRDNARDEAEYIAIKANYDDVVVSHWHRKPVEYCRLDYCAGVDPVSGAISVLSELLEDLQADFPEGKVPGTRLLDEEVNKRP